MVASSSSSSSSSSSFFFLVLLVACTATVTTGFDNFYEENALYPGQRLRTNEALRWGTTEFMMQSDCNLCLHHGWCSYTNAKSTQCSTFLLPNGNLAVYGHSVNGGKRLWQTNTAGARGDYVLLLQEDKNAVLYGRSIWSTRKPWRPVVATSAAAANDHLAALERVEPVGSDVGAAQPASDGRYAQNVLYEGERLLVNQELSSKSYRLIMQADCNLVLYNAYDVLWVSDTSNFGTRCSAGLGNDGNLVIYNDVGCPVWSSGSSSGNGDYILILRNDGVAMIYGKVLWSALPFKPRGLTTTSNSTSTSSCSSSKISMVTGNE